MLLSYQPCFMFCEKKNNSNIYKNDNNTTNDANSLYAYFTGITNKTRANPHCYYNV